MKKIVLALGAFVFFSVAAQAQSLSQDEKAAQDMKKKAKTERVVEKKTEATGVEKKAAKVVTQDQAADMKKAKAKVKAKATKVDN